MSGEKIIQGLREAVTMARLMADNQRMREALEDCADYLEQRADADCEGDPPRYIPNDEMRLLTVVQRALGEMP